MKNSVNGQDNGLSENIKNRMSLNFYSSMKNVLKSEIESQKSEALFFVAFEIIIKDSGVGISPEDIDKMFIKFNMIGNRFANKTGTGLGLSICKHFINKMGGDVKVVSDGIGHGTSFII